MKTDQPKWQKFKRAYKKAVKDGKDIFIFEGKEVLTAYAKNLLEYLASQGLVK